MHRVKNLLVWALALYIAPLAAQLATEGCIADFNRDGITDTLAFADDPEPCDYAYLATFTDGKTGVKSGVPREEYCRCHIRSILPVPPALWQPENADVLASMKTKLLPPERATPDASLAWILRGLQNRRKLNKHPHFELFIDAGLEPKTGKAELPGTYSVPVDCDNYEGLFKNSQIKDVGADKGYAIYYGHNHYQRRDARADSVVLVATTPKLQIHRTSHGLFAQSPTNHHWLFVTDHALTGAPDKLRWTSIGDVSVWDDRLLVLEHRKPVSSGTAIFLIDLKTGRTVRLRKDLLGEPDDRISFSIQGNALELKATAPGDAKGPEVDLTLPLETLLKELDRL